MCRITLFPTDAAAFSKLEPLKQSKKVKKSLGKVLEYAPWLSIAISVALKASFQLHKCQCPGPSGWPDAYKQKKHSGLLCFLVAGRRIELRTS